MEFEYDPAKDLKNQQEHGLSLADVHWLDWDNALIKIDSRKDYGEVRVQAYACSTKDQKLYMVVFTERNNLIRIISFRRANKREEKLYHETTDGDDNDKRNKK